ncbi:MAG TPA: hypothetical protein VH300_08880 [Thermoleophilaceae bacterium]|jgi:hypothetical protein|nr:hypothetical protein [Thermoleophilaceae bacterium]
MKRITGIVLLAAALALPVAAMGDQPSTTDKQNAAKECKALLKAEGTSNFKHAWGAKGKGRAYGKCVSSKSKEEATERQDAQTNAAKQCKSEKAMSDADFQAAHGGKTFADFYGAKNAHSAYGKCVSTNAKRNKAEADQKDQNTISAAKSCRGDQTKDSAAFKTTYKNFGACVSKQAHQLNAQRQQSQ